MVGEQLITRESLVDMFASFDVKCRQEILASLEKSIEATIEDCEEAKSSNESILASVRNLQLMESCCKQAQEEFEELSRKETAK